MAREKFKTLTEQMYYVLMALQEERCGVDIMECVREITSNRVKLGPGTLYALLGDFQNKGIIKEAKSHGQKKEYIITAVGKELLEKEHERHLLLVSDYSKYYKG